MYQYYAVKRNPQSLWMLDKASPFSDFTGFNKSGTATGTVAKSVSLVSGAAWSSVFKSGVVGKFASNVFKQGSESRQFALEAWVLPIPKMTTGDQQILSHSGQFDGLSINGKVIRFGTAYLTTGTAYCDFDLREYQLAHVVGIHNEDSNELWVNGVMVAQVFITQEQKADQYVATDGFLYSGHTTSTQEIAMNAVAIYGSLSGDDIQRNYEAGLDALPRADVYPQYAGQLIALNAGEGSLFMNESWVDRDDFESGLKENVEYAPDQINPAYEDGVSAAGSWTCSVPLDAQKDTSIYGVMLSWSGQGVTVESSLNGTTWAEATNGELLSNIADGFNPTGKDLQIRVSFAGGSANDESYLESLSLYAWRDNKFNATNREVTVSHPAVLRGDYEPNLYRDDNGVYLNGGTLTIGADASADPWPVRTVEMWVKMVSGSFTVNFGSATVYSNGETYSGLPVGEWVCAHVVQDSDFAGPLTVTGDMILGQIVLYPTTFTQADAKHIFKSYTGRPVTRVVDTDSVFGVSETASPVSIYAPDWSITAAG